MEQQRHPRWRRLALSALLLLTLGAFGYQWAHEPRWTKEDARLLADTAFQLGVAARCGAEDSARQAQLKDWVAAHFIPFPEQFDLLRQAKFDAGRATSVTPAGCTAVQRSLAAADWGVMHRKWYQG